MLLMYARLHFVLHRAHNNFMSFDEEDPYGSGSHGGNTLSSATPRVQSVNLVKLSDNSSDQDRILPPTPPPKPRTRRARGSSDLKRLSYQMMMYPLVYGIVWALPTGIRIYQAVTGKSAGFTISTIDKVRIPTSSLHLICCSRTNKAHSHALSFRASWMPSSTASTKRRGAAGRSCSAAKSPTERQITTTICVLDAARSGTTRFLFLSTPASRFLGTMTILLGLRCYF